jgi:hemerythrin-like domain-containing protein
LRETRAAQRATAKTPPVQYCVIYQVALPLHEADENESIYPRLHRKLPSGYLAAANESMVQQHTAIDALVAELLPMWQAIAENPEAQKRVSDELRDRVKQLQQLWNTHLRLEEQDVVPAMRAFLSEQDLRAIQAEMRAPPDHLVAVPNYGFVPVTCVTTNSGICLFQAEG